MNNNPKVRVKVAFEGYCVGDEFQPNGLYRDHLIARGLVEIIRPADVAEHVKAEVRSEVKLPRRSKAMRKGAALA